MNHFTEHAGVKETKVVNRRNAVSEPLDTVQERLKFVFGKQVVDADLGVRAADAVNELA